MLGLAEKALDVLAAALSADGPSSLVAARLVLSRAEQPAFIGMPSGHELQRRFESEQARLVDERLRRMSNDELSAEIEHLRNRGAPTVQAERMRFERLSPDEQGKLISAAARAVYVRRGSRQQA